eukprot:symbB.v1.2.027595.t1/scaffold2834.1/size69276/2
MVNVFTSRGGACEVPRRLEGKFCLEWRADLHQCVDAPPLLVKVSDSASWYLLIGSHSHELGCFHATGHTLWRRRLSDRIEAGCAVAKQRVFAVCYDGQMHCLQLGSGVLVWSTRLVSESQNDREIKSAPVVAKNVVIVGTHAGTVAGVDAMRR